jgi:hypothetical protein
MFSKLIPRNSTGFKVCVTENPHYQVPIPLFPEPDKGCTGNEMVKLKLGINPLVASSSTYESHTRLGSAMHSCILLFAATNKLFKNTIYPLTLFLVEISLS